MSFCIFNQQRLRTDVTQNTATSPMLQRCVQFLIIDLMDKKLFKKLIEENAEKIGFLKIKTSFFRESNDAFVFLIPRRSGYSNKYYLRTKVELKPTDTNFDKNEFLKHDVANITLSVDTEDPELFDLKNHLDDFERMQRLKEFFKNVIDPLVNKMLCKERIIEFHKTENLFLLPYTKSKLGIE